jgi:mannose-6-phosphate isomerase-like protein (cupin superfamily)
MMHSHIKAGGCGPGLHYHRSDQLYYLIEGLMNIQLGTEIHHIRAETFVLIPAGLAHRNWNEGPGDETHLEMIIPAPAPMAPLTIMVDSPDDVPAADHTDRHGYPRRVDREKLSQPLPGLRVQSLSGAGSLNAIVHYVEVDPGSAGPDTHIHEFDQYCLVLDGELTVEVALEKHVVSPRELVVLPAGVPHRQHNTGAVARHVDEAVATGGRAVIGGKATGVGTFLRADRARRRRPVDVVHPRGNIRANPAGCPGR